MEENTYIRLVIVRSMGSTSLDQFKWPLTLITGELLFLDVGLVVIEFSDVLR